MKDIKIGLKFKSNELNLMDRIVSDIQELVDYFEILLIPTELKDITKLNKDYHYVIHAPHFNYGVNIGDPEKREFNLEMIKESLEIADELDSKYVILHPGFGDSHSMEEILGEISDKRITLENMPKAGLHGGDCLGYSPDAMKHLLEKFGMKFCLDLGHAYKAGISIGENYKNLIQRFLDLEPSMFHLSDGNTDEEKDEHLSLGKGKFDLKYLVDCISKSRSKKVTLETPRQRGFDEDKENILYLKNLI